MWKSPVNVTPPLWALVNCTLDTRELDFAEEGPDSDWDEDRREEGYSEEDDEDERDTNDESDNAGLGSQPATGSDGEAPRRTKAARNDHFLADDVEDVDL